MATPLSHGIGVSGALRQPKTVSYPISIKGVLLIDGKVLLVRNDRNEWELPGGRLEIDETPEQTLAREFQEELSIRVEATGIVDSYVFEVIPTERVFIVTYGCRLRGRFGPIISEEHTEFGLHALGDLGRLPLPMGYRRSIETWSAHAES